MIAYGIYWPSIAKDSEILREYIAAKSVGSAPESATPTPLERAA